MRAKKRTESKKRSDESNVPKAEFPRRPRGGACLLRGSLEGVDEINRPSHYTSHPSGVECIDIAEHHGFCVGNALKYLWRAGLKRRPGEAQAEAERRDLEKARWYIDRRLLQLQRKPVGESH